MKIENEKIKCDFYGCPNLANYKFKTNSIWKGQMCFCKSCATKIFEEVSKDIIPKSVEPPFKKLKK